MSERIDYNSIGQNDPRYKNFENTHTANFNDFQIDVYRLHELTEGHPVEKVPLDDYLEQLEHPCWTDSNNEHVSPRTVIDVMVAKGIEGAKETYPQFQKHINQILSADRSYPLYIYENVIIDGSHRLAQVYFNLQTGHSSQNFVTIKRLTSIPKGAQLAE